MAAPSEPVNGTEGIIVVAIRPRVAATLSAALSAALLVATLTGAARQPAVSDPVQAAFTPPGPYATTTGTPPAR